MCAGERDYSYLYVCPAADVNKCISIHVCVCLSLSMSKGVDQWVSGSVCVCEGCECVFVSSNGGVCVYMQRTSPPTNLWQREYDAIIRQLLYLLCLHVRGLCV